MPLSTDDYPPQHDGMLLTLILLLLAHRVRMICFARECEYYKHCHTIALHSSAEHAGMWLTKDKVGEGPAGAGDTANALHLGGRDVGCHHAQCHAMCQRHVHPHKQGAP